MWAKGRACGSSFEQVYAIFLPLYFFGRIGPRAKAVVTRITESNYCRKDGTIRFYIEQNMA
jgi:hypothetical protein